MTAVLGGLLLFLGSYAAVEAVRRYAIRRRVLDIPNPRSSHTAPTPRGGGVVIVAATLLSLGVAGAVDPVGMTPAVASFFLGGILVAAVGWLDDIRGLSSGTRIAVHFAAAILLLYGAGWWAMVDLPLMGTARLGWLAVPLALLWTVGMTNAYNFMDGIDGVAAGQAVVAGAGWAIFGWATALPSAAAVGVGVALSSGAFLLHNWSPARVFMGDTGSGFLGFTFAALPFVVRGTGEGDQFLRLPLAAALLVWPFVFDALFTVVRRSVRRENVLQAHRSHLYQRLVLAGLGHPTVAALYTGLAVVGAVLAAAWLREWSGAGPTIATGIPLLSLLLIALVRRVERRSAPA